MGWAILLALILIGWGLLSLFAKDQVWEWTRGKHERAGIAAERTDEWDNSTALRGVWAIVCGLALAGVACALAFRGEPEPRTTPGTNPVVISFTESAATRVAQATAGAVATNTALASLPPPEPDEDLYEVEAVLSGAQIRILQGEQEQTLEALGLSVPRRVGECFGRESLDQARELLEGKRIRIARDPRFGSGRGNIPAYIWTEDGTFYNLAMIEGGYATTRTDVGPYAYQAQFEVAERAAQAGGRGLWSPDGCAGRRSGTPPARPTATRATPTRAR